MKKITLKEFWNSENKIAIHCKTTEEAKQLLNAFDKLGKSWSDGKSYLGMDHYNNYKEYTCYSNINGYCYIDWYKKNDFKIYEFDEVDLGA
jgi:hypothetical protein